jgi:transcription elongation GreA/GreB family factor
MSPIQRIRMTSHDYTRLHDELAALRSRRGVEVPDDLMDYDPKLRARHSARQARICQIEGLLTNAAIVGEAAAFDPVAEAGTVLTIRYDDTGETETFLLGRPGPVDGDVKVYSMASPLGRVIAGARPGDQRFYAIPDGTGRFVTLLKSRPYGMHITKGIGPQTASRGAMVSADARKRTRDRGRSVDGMGKFTEKLKSVLMHHELSDIPAKHVDRWEDEGGFVAPRVSRLEGTSDVAGTRDKPIGGDNAGSETAGRELRRQTN